MLFLSSWLMTIPAPVVSAYGIDAGAQPHGRSPPRPADRAPVLGTGLLVVSQPTDTKAAVAEAAAFTAEGRPEVSNKPINTHVAAALMAFATSKETRAVAETPYGRKLAARWAARRHGGPCPRCKDIRSWVVDEATNTHRCRSCGERFVPATVPAPEVTP